MLVFEKLTIGLNELPEVARAAAAPDSPAERRLLLARATIPMSPVDVVTTVAFLVSDPSDLVSAAARATIENMPMGMLVQASREIESPAVLDTIARNTLDERSELLEDIVHNKLTADETVGWIASRGEGTILDIIAKNQLRLQRNPRIVEAIYFNPKARMGLVLNLLEDAVRLDLDMSNIPGYDEIVASIRGGDAKKAAAAAKAATEAPTDERPPEEKPEQEGPEPIQVEEEAPAEGVEGAEGAEGVDDDTFAAILQHNVEEGPAANAEAAEDGPIGKNMLTAIAKMSIPQKVRMALLGNESVRRQLIRDTRRAVYMSVMKSPRLTDKEVSDYAKNKALNEEVIRMIATNREWTHSYATKIALIENPKCPSALATGFLRVMTQKDIKGFARSHDVPGYIARAAKNILDAIEAGKKF